MTKTNLLEGRIVLKRANSEVNGELVVLRDFAFGTYIHGGGLPQSGGLAEWIWKDSLKEIKKEKENIDKCLIIGLGGGSIAKLVRKNWPDAKITGVDIDPVIVELGKRYMGLAKSNVDVHIEDAEDFIKKQTETRNSYDLVCFDTYVKASFPKKFESVQLIKQVKSLLSVNGLAVFNRLYGPDDRASAISFEKKLQEVFGKVERLYPEANVMFVCQK
jgi:spermidine synthase